MDKGLQLLFEDRVDAVIADYPFCAFAAFRYQEKGLIAGEAHLTYEPVGIALPPNDPLLANWVENFLGELEGNGNLSALGERWFEDGS